MARSTPWGSAQESISISRGVSCVSTASHGGIMVTLSAAEMLLSEHAKKRGMQWSGYLCYEEDCNADIVLFDSELLLSLAVSKGVFGEGRTEQQVKDCAYKSLSFWNADYLLDKGVEPEAVAYEEWKARKEADILRANKDPDFIVLAHSESHTLLQGILCIGTADGENHYVTKESYRPIYEKCNNRLSKCVVVDEKDIPKPLDRVVPYLIANAPKITSDSDEQTIAVAISKFDRMIVRVIDSLTSMTISNSNETYRECYDRLKRHFQFTKDLFHPAYADAKFYKYLD